jgi:hypothetical protein
MRPIITFALTAVLTITFASCNNQESINQKARLFVSERGDYACDILSDSLDIGRLFPKEYLVDPEGDLKDLCSPSTFSKQCVLYKGDNSEAIKLADYYNALIIFTNLYSDNETAGRFGEDDETVYATVADSIAALDCSFISNNELRQIVLRLQNAMKSYVLNRPKNSYDNVDQATQALFTFLRRETDSILENTRDEYISYNERIPFTNNFDSIVALRGTSYKAYQQELLTKMYLVETPAERHMYAIEFAHSDSTNAHFLIGAAVLNREFVETRQYSPYLSEMWRTWRASMSTLIGASSWSYIPNSLYNAKRRQVAEIIIKHIEAYPNDILAQGVLIDLAGIDNISRHGSYFGNASILEQMTMFPEWDKSKRIVN